MAVKKIKVGTVEANLRRVSTSAEMIKKLQDQKEAAMREYARERMRYRGGEIARDVFTNLTRSHKRRMASINKRISTLVAKSKTSLSALTALVAVSRTTVKRRKKAKKKVKKKRRKKAKKKKVKRKKVKRKRRKK